MKLTDRVSPDPDSLYLHFAEWASEKGISLYPHQDEAVMEIVAGSNLIMATPTGSGKSLVAVAAHFAALARDEVSFYTAPIKALVSEKFFSLCDIFGATNVGMITGDASVNADAPIICCTAEILANLALREGSTADVGTVIMDEFHFYSEPDRGWAWQVPLLELSKAQFIVMSATLGDVDFFVDDLNRRTKRTTTVISDAPRPVPLSYEWSMLPIVEKLEELVVEQKAPVYVVHFTQAQAAERAQQLMSMNLLTKEEKAKLHEEIGAFQFGVGYGKTLRKLVHHGIGIHHAGMLPKYRRLVEQLAQTGLLKVICGTDTLGVGINVPIRTVLLTGLTKFDGSKMRRLKSREFHQIAGRAGRAGFDTAGYVVVQAPEHVIENERALARAGDDPKKRRKVVRKSPPEGFVNWDEDTFTRIVESQPEALVSRMRVSHALLLNVIERPGDPWTHLDNLLRGNHSDARTQRQLVKKAIQLGKGLLASGVLRRQTPDEDGRPYALTVELQENFALNQPLAPFAVAALELLDQESETYALDVVSVVESILEDPFAVLLAQKFKAKGEAVAEMKLDGVEYEDRMAQLEDVTWPKPLEDLLEHALGLYQQSHPWANEQELSPKSVVRDMWERALDFNQFIAYYGLGRSEGLLLRYLSDAYRALRQTVPSSAQTEAVDDVIEWLGETIRQTDSSLLDEWESLTDPDAVAKAAASVGKPPAPPRPVTGNERVFATMLRNGMFRRVELAARDAWQELGALEAAVATSVEPSLKLIMDADAWADALDDYWDEHDDILLDADARNPKLLAIEKQGRMWKLAQTIRDPESNHDWRILAECDLDRSDLIGSALIYVQAFERM